MNDRSWTTVRDPANDFPTRFVDNFPRRDLDVLSSQGKIHGGAKLKRSILIAILTDSQFWAPAVALALGIALLAYLH